MFPEVPRPHLPVFGHGHRTAPEGLGSKECHGGRSLPCVQERVSSESNGRARPRGAIAGNQ